MFALKIPKIGALKIITIIVLTKWTVWFDNIVMQLNDADGMANIVDPDQTAPFGAV